MTVIIESSSLVYIRRLQFNYIFFSVIRFLDGGFCQGREVK